MEKNKQELEILRKKVMSGGGGGASGDGYTKAQVNALLALKANQTEVDAIEATIGDINAVLEEVL